MAIDRPRSLGDLKQQQGTKKKAKPVEEIEAPTQQTRRAASKPAPEVADADIEAPLYLDEPAVSKAGQTRQEDGEIVSEETPEDEERPLHILEVRTKNVQRIVRAIVRPNKSLTIIKGPNGAGKTSWFNGVIEALGGKKMGSEEPLRRGAETGSVEVDLGPHGGPVLMKAVRTYTEEGSSLILTTSDGRSSKSQGALDVLRGALSFDPIEFARAKVASQRETLLALVGLDKVFAKLELTRTEIFDERRDIGRKQGQAEAVALDARPENGEPGYEVEELMPLETLDRDVETAREALSNSEGAADRLADLQIAEQRARKARDETLEMIEIAKKTLVDREKAAAETLSAFHLAEDAADGATLDDDRTAYLAAQTAVSNAKEINVTRAQIAAKQRSLDEKSAAWAELTAEYDEHTERLDAIAAQKAEALAAADFPVPGLGVDEKGVLFEGLPFAQAMESDRYRVSIAIAMRQHPRLRVALVRDGSGLGPEKLVLIDELVSEQGGQAIIEMVYTASSQQGIVLVEDGYAGDAIPGKD